MIFYWCFKAVAEKKNGEFNFDTFAINENFVLLFMKGVVRMHNDQYICLLIAHCQSLHKVREPGYM